MARNIEVKAGLRNPERQRELVAGIASAEPVEMIQEDTFYEVPGGRLKLRKISSTTGELIFYRRADHLGPKTSHYSIVKTNQPDDLCALLSAALPVGGVVRKRRVLFMVGRTRVHLDHVQGLGDFLELEVVLEPHETARDGEREARDLMVSLEIEESDLIDRAYVDLLEGRSPPASLPE